MGQTYRATPSQPATSFSDLFTDALRARSTSLTQLREELVARGHQVSLATLSYWRSGQRSPSQRSLEVVTELERLLDLVPGTLLGAVSPELPVRGPRGRTVDWSRPEGVRKAMTRAREVLGLGDELEQLRPLSLSSGMDIGPDRRPTAVGSRVLYQADRTGISRTTAVLDLEEPVAQRPPLRQLVGAAEGRVVSFPDLGVFVTELVLPRPLRRGETVLVSHTYAWPRDVRPWQEHWVETVRTYAELTMWVRFHPDAVPTRWELFTVTPEEDRTVPLDPRRLTSAHLHLTSFGPGRAGIRWEY